MMDNVEILMIAVYKTHTMIEERKFVFDCFEDCVLTDQTVFINTLSAETLTIERRNLDYIITKPYRQDN